MASHACPDCRGDELPFRKALGPLLLITAVFFCNFLCRVVLAPFLVGLEREFDMTHAAAGRLFLYMSSGMAPMMACSGFVAQRLTHRRTIILAAAGLGLAMLLLSAAQGTWQLKAGVFVIGLAAGLYFPSGVSAITSVLRPRDWGKGLSVHELAPNLTTIVVPALAAAMGTALTWRSAFAAFGLCNLAVAVAFGLRGRGGDFPGEAPRPSVLAELVAMPAFWILAVVFSLAVCASMGPYNMLVLYLVEDKAMSVESANTLLTMSRVAGPFMVLATGFIVDRVGAWRTAVISLGCTGVLTIALGVFSGTALKAAVIAQPVLSVCFFPAGWAAASHLFRAPVRNVAVSLITPTAIFLGNGLTPALMGAMGDRGLFDWSFILMGAAVCSGMFLTFPLRFTDRRARSREEEPPLPGPGPV